MTTMFFLSSMVAVTILLIIWVFGSDDGDSLYIDKRPRMTMFLITIHVFYLLFYKFIIM